MRKLLLAGTFFFILTSLNAQQTGEVFAPFVSRVRAVAENNTVKLTWKDSEHIDGTYRIYRHDAEITAGNFHQAVRVGEVEQGTESFTDYPDSTGPFYYAVLVKDPDNKLYELFIPFRNVTTKSVALKNLGTEQELSAEINDIGAQVQKDSILVTFESSKEDRELIVYRGTSPIRSAADLAFVQPLRAIPSSRSSFQDFPVPGINYYYAILDSGLVKVGDITFRPGRNSTILPAIIPVGNRVGLPETTVSRNLPLPMLPLTRSIETGRNLDSPPSPFLPEMRELSLAASKSVASLMQKVESPDYETLESTILDVDKGPVVSGGEEYTLKSILNREFKEKRWLETEKLFRNFLSVHRSEDIEKRARFYLGQTLYFQEKYFDSFMQFILIRDSLYTEVNPWLDNLFRRLRA